ncbi:hypothetical protein [Amycolatopsis sp. NPDC058986]|uniref:hypothetical protein n=1 Tax=Amycolatopsis sp. NPDC058986 TaxID=3346685 RepID=UPI00366E4A56
MRLAEGRHVPDAPFTTLDVLNGAFTTSSLDPPAGLAPRFVANGAFATTKAASRR